MADNKDQPRSSGGRFARTPADAVKAADREEAIVALALRGLNYPQIAAQLGINKGDVHKTLHKALQARAKEQALDRDALIERELARLDLAQQAVMDVLERHHVTVSNGRVVELHGETIPDPAPVLAAVDRLVKVSESRRKLLGLDSAQKLDLSGGVRYEVVGVPSEDLT